MAAVVATRTVFAERHIQADKLAPAQMQLLPADEKADEGGRNPSTKRSDRQRRAWSRTGQTFCSAIFGYDQIFYRATGAL